MGAKNFLLTGAPGVGKTTIVIKLARLLGDKAAGFYTAEIRANNRRRGFEIVSLASGEKSVLAHIDFQGRYRVGKYGVKPENLSGVIDEINNCIVENRFKCLIIDEIGKMELYNAEFREAVLLAIESPLPVVATIMARPHPFCDALKKRADVRLIEVTKDNRDELPEKIIRDFLLELGFYNLGASFKSHE
ncbi:NTPase [Calderihabitans maritimus]|uniref:AAA+ ATPase domain-containing protein n=1 Tax=Calderihabitans maritimus TaxID=1246530 RepID=A0A1Z5HQI7_9FIRM|nr:NTPase [Calderihabitans maritimus]GAW91698.1 hypothetical protein Nther_0640 [Calderihabitans maritimus]